MSLIAAVRPRIRNTSENPPPSTTVVVTPSSFSLEVGATRQLVATVENGVGVTSWESSDETVATVSQSGLVTGVGQGQATITAVNNGSTGNSTVTMVPPGQPVTYVFGPGSHEPEGLLPFIAYDPGTHGIDMREAHGDGFSGAQFGPNSDWFDGRMTVVADADTPGGFALRQEWPAGTGTRSGNAGWNWSGHTPDPDLYPGWNGQIGELKTLYVRFLHFKETSWVHNPNNAKLIGFEMAVDHVNGLDAYLQDMSRDEVWWRWQFSVNRGADFGEHESSDEDFPGFVQTGKWYDIEFLIIAQSAPGVADGQLHVWVNGAKVPGWNNVTLGGSSDGTGLEVVSEGGAGTGYEGINVWPYYNGGSQVLKTKDEYMRWGGLYMSGA